MNAPQVDMIVEGSLAVDISGDRMGKGGGYGDEEISHLNRKKDIMIDIPISVWSVQFNCRKCPQEHHDQKINRY